MASRIVLIKTKSHMERGGRPTKKTAMIEIMPLMITCQPIAMYFSSDCFSSRFHKAWRVAEESSRTRARMGIESVNVS